MNEPAGEQRTFGHYEVESVLGRGAMGLVYLARDRRIGRRVALKTVHVDEKFEDDSEANEFFKRLQREAELGGALQHPNIVTLYEPGYENDIIAWLATEYVDGESLRDRLRKRKPLPLPEALRIAEDILRGLAYAHAKGIIHRDIKPANILITSSGEAKIADFGIARPPDSNLTAVGEMLGTPSYMSPEQVKCTAVTTRSDLFSTGALIYEMVCGTKAFAASDVTSILRNVVEATPKPASEVNPEVPESLAQFVAKLLAKVPEERFESTAMALEELQRIRLEVDDTERPEVEELHESAAVSTMAAQSTHPTATDVDFDDRTPAISTRSTLRRPIAPPVFYGIISVLLMAFAATALTIRARSNPAPAFAYSPAQITEFRAKRQLLENARTLYSSGELERSVAAYESYVKKYPNGKTGREELGEAKEALAAANAEKTRVTVTGSRPKKPAAKPSEKPPEKKKSFWRRIFTG